MKHVVLSTLFFLSLFSCSSGDQYEQAHKWSWDDFKEQKQLQGQVLEFDSLVMKPNDLRVYDSLLITINYNCDKLFHVFNLNTKKQVGQRIGRGARAKRDASTALCGGEKRCYPSVRHGDFLCV